MSSEAPLGWAKLHVKPHLMCLAFFATIVSCCVSAAMLYGVGLSWPTAVIHVPYLTSTSAMISLAALVWRGGPVAAEASVGRSLGRIWAISSFFAVTASFVGPGNLVPFNNQMANLLGCACFIFSGFANGAFGGNPADRPQQPYTSFVPPVVNAAFSTLLFIDTLSDLGFVRILLQQVRLAPQPLPLFRLCHHRLSILMIATHSCNHTVEPLQASGDVHCYE